MAATSDPTPQPFLDRTRHLVASGERFRWISEERRGYYAAILHLLVEHRRAHEHEVLHDELLAEVGPALEAALGAGAAAGYEAVQFRQDLEQLQRWGNVVERVEATRIQSLSDRGRHKLLLRIDPTTARFLDFLDAEANPLPPGLRDKGANLLEDVLQGLREGRRLLAQVGGEGDRLQAEVEDVLLRAAHLIREADERTERIANELVEFGELLSRFVAEPFRVESLRELTGWLERYVDRYLIALEEKGQAIRGVLKKLAKQDLETALALAEGCEEARLAGSPELLRGGFRPQSLRSVLQGLGRFYDRGAGLAVLCGRINRRTRAAIRRLQRYVEAVRLRNVRTEAIRARTSELFQLPAGAEGDALAHGFIEELVAPVLCRADGRDGHAQQRVAPPRPARRYGRERPAFRGAPLEGKRSTPEASRELERRRLARLSAFIEKRVLHTADSAHLADVEQLEAGEGALLTGAVKAWFLRGGRARKHLRYRIEEGQEVGRRALFEGPEGQLDVLDLKVLRGPENKVEKSR